MRVPIVSYLNLPSPKEILRNYNKDNPDRTIFAILDYKITPHPKMYPVIVLDMEEAPKCFDLTEEINRMYGVTKGTNSLHEISSCLSP